MEEKSEGIKLIPDEDGFLFEIEDHNYIISKLWGIICPFLGIVFILNYLNMDIKTLANYDHRGHALVYIGIPWIIFESIRVFLYLKNKNYKKIKFYEDYIINNKNEKLYLIDLIDSYVIKLNLSNNKIFRKSPLFLLFLPIFIIIPSVALFSIILYNLFKRKSLIIIPNTLIIARYDNSAIGIPLKIITKSDKIKLELYIEKYFKRDINRMEKRFLIAPEFRTYNLVDEKRKKEILKEKFNQ